jgi:TPR repeat protein/serine/threonine protein kinase
MTTGDVDPLTVRAEARVGSILKDKYRLNRVLGIGGMAAVYHSTHRNQAEFAVKMLHPELSLREDVRTRFLREGYAANSVRHAGAVLVVDDDVDEQGSAFLVMELLRGAPVETLRERCPGQRMPMPAVLSVADQLLDVLDAAHENGIVHRDIKPENLFATADGTLKVLDFGIARVREATMGAGSGSGTGTGVLLGTPMFMAPEQAYAKANEIDGQTDVWAVGATLFTLLSGESVHLGENATQLMVQAATTRARSVATAVGGLPAAVASFIDRALAFEKPARWPSARSMREAVHAASIEAFGIEPSKAYLAELVASLAPETARVRGTTPMLSAPPPPAPSSALRTPHVAVLAPTVAVDSAEITKAPSLPRPPPPAPAAIQQRALAALFGTVVLGTAAMAGLRASQTQAVVILDAGTRTEPKEPGPPCASADLAACTTQCLKSELVSCFNLGQMYANGRGVAKDEARAVETYNIACEKGHLQSCASLGFLLRTTRAVPKDDARAVSVFRRACDGGNQTGCNGLGLSYDTGSGGLDRDEGRAATLFKQACDAGEAPGCTNLGSQYMRGRGVERDDAHAVRLFKQGCDGEHAVGCALLGHMISKARGAPKDDALANSLLQKGCDGGAGLGCAYLGIQHSRGRGTPKDEAGAATLFKQGCDDANPYSCAQWGEALAYGRGIAKDEQAAVTLLHQGCDSGGLAACAYLGQLYVDGRGVSKDTTQAVALFQRACTTDGDPGCYDLGLLHEKGIGVAVDRKGAISLYRKGCRADDLWACAQLQRLGVHL